LRLSGQGWKTTSTAASQEVDWIIENQPVQGTTAPTSKLVFSYQVNSGGYTSEATLSSAGLLTIASLTVSGDVQFASLTSGTQVSCLGLDAGNNVVPLTGSCGTSGGSTITAGTTATSGFTSGDIIGSNSNLAVDTGVPYPVAPGSYFYPYGFGNGSCFSAATCTVPTGQVAANGIYKGTASNALAYLWDNNRWVNNNTIPFQIMSTNPLGVEDGNAVIPSQTITGKTFSLRFTSSNITGSPVTVTYTGGGGDTVATVATKLCNAVIANTNLSSATTGEPVVCDANQGGGGFNLQWSVLINPVTVASVGTGTITLPTTQNVLDGIFFYYSRAIVGYTLTAGDTTACAIFTTNSAITHENCDLVVSNSGGNNLVTDTTIDITVANATARIAEFSQGMKLDCPSGDAQPGFAGIGTLTICNSEFGGGIYFSPATGGTDARIFENSGGGLIFSTASNFAFQLETGADIFDFGSTNTGAFTFPHNIYLTGQPTTGGTRYVCQNGTTGELSVQSSC
jgi:hypothetical protein